MIITEITSNKEIIELVQLLHVSLETNDIIDNFHSAISQQLSIEGLRYHYESTDIDYLIGDTTEYNHSYHLNIDKLELGEIQIFSKQQLNDDEVLLLEEYLCLIVSPLKNAVLHQKAIDAAMHDPLTGLLNRSSLDDTLVREIQLAKRHDRYLSLLSIDLDDFKSINDRFGHSAGDAVITHFSKHLMDTIRNTDVGFRVGGEEFLVILSNTENEGAIILAERVRHKIESSPVLIKDRTIQYTVSIGISTFDGLCDHKILVENADAALYKAKAEGKNQIQLF